MTKDDGRFLWRWFKGWAIGSAVAIVILTAPCKAHAVFYLGSAWLNEGTSAGNVPAQGCVAWGAGTGWGTGFGSMFSRFMF